MVITLVQIAKSIRQLGGRIFLVGGGVRDLVKGKELSEIDDFDFMITGIETEDFLIAFPFAKKVISETGFLVFYLDIEVNGKVEENSQVAFARIEKKDPEGEGHGDFIPFSSKELTYEDDMKRRDFPFNAMAVEIFEDGTISLNHLLDPFNGEKDLEKGIVQGIFIPQTKQGLLQMFEVEEVDYIYSLPKTKLKEGVLIRGAYVYQNEDGQIITCNITQDALRFVRCFRFAARFEFQVSDETKELIRMKKDMLKSVSAERILLEIEKVIKSGNMDIFFRGLDEVGALEIIMPTMFHLFHFEQEKYQQTIKFVQQAIQVGLKNEIKFSLLFHMLTEKEIKQMAKELKFSTEQLENVLLLQKQIPMLLKYDKLSSEELYELLDGLQKHPYKRASESKKEKDHFLWFKVLVDELEGFYQQNGQLKTTLKKVLILIGKLYEKSTIEVNMALPPKERGLDLKKRRIEFLEKEKAESF